MSDLPYGGARETRTLGRLPAYVLAGRCITTLPLLLVEYSVVNVLPYQGLLYSGGGDGNRTHNLLLAKQAHSLIVLLPRMLAALHTERPPLDRAIKPWDWAVLVSTLSALH